MLDIKLIKENPKLVKENIKKKFQTEKLILVDKVISSNNEWIKIKKELDELRHKRNTLSEEINKLKKEGRDISQKIKEVKELPDKIKSAEEQEQNLSQQIKEALLKIPNIIHKSVPIGKDASKNKVIKKIGAIPKFKFPVKNHVELAESLGVADFDASAKTTGNGFYFLKGQLAILNQALIQFAIDSLVKKGYTYIEPPLMIKQRISKAATDFQTFKDTIYVIENEDLTLIPTAEYVLLGMHDSETLKEEELPLKYAGYSMCFRKEIGSHGINEKGLWRTHQFNKVEQFIFCKPEDSYKYYDELLKNTEELFKKLKLPYRVLEMCSGDLSLWKAKSSDIEVYRPTTKQYEEIASLTNCTDYQARKLGIKILRKNGTKEILHTLNNTAIATSRAMVAILENYQQKDGSIKIPAVLQKYTKFKKIEKEK